MPRLSKQEIARRAEAQVRIGKAKESLVSNFAKLMGKHIEALIRPGQETRGNVAFIIRADASAGMRIEYTTQVTDGANFPLDDGQNDLLPAPGEPAGNSAEPKPEPEPEAEEPEPERGA